MIQTHVSHRAPASAHLAVEVTFRGQRRNKGKVVMDEIIEVIEAQIDMRSDPLLKSKWDLKLAGAARSDHIDLEAIITTQVLRGVKSFVKLVPNQCVISTPAVHVPLDRKTSKACPQLLILTR